MSFFNRSWRTASSVRGIATTRSRGRKKKQRAREATEERMKKKSAGKAKLTNGRGRKRNRDPTRIQSSLAMAVVSSGTSTMIPAPGMSQQVQQGMQPLGVNNAAANMPLQQETSGAMQSTQSKYVKVWEGRLCGHRLGQPIFITRLEGYRSYTASESLASKWPAEMQIVRLLSQDHMNNKQYVGKADFLVFQAMNQHGLLPQLHEKKLCAVIQLPSQTLLLSVSDKPCRLSGMLFPGDMEASKPEPQLSGEQQQQHQQTSSAMQSTN